MKEITTVGVDLAKSVFTVHGVDAMGRVVLRKTVRREQLMELIAGLPPCLIGVEACGGAHDEPGEIGGMSVKRRECWDDRAWV